MGRKARIKRERREWRRAVEAVERRRFFEAWKYVTNVTGSTLRWRTTLASASVPELEQEPRS